MPKKERESSITLGEQLAWDVVQYGAQIDRALRRGAPVDITRAREMWKKLEDQAHAINRIRFLG